ncbi:MAG: hypothetical protein M0D53_07375 [Flavobacterium sp. JAD_PAG50586_2]|nr:MAG: hypothetical protein M0D53_07375 [Flavobacterium sp. JAD_PAG50586_2]
MKTITPKDAFKLFLFLLILFSAKAFSFTKLPDEASSSGYGSRLGYVSKTKNTSTSKTTSKTYTAVSKGKAVKPKSIALRSTATPRISL